MIKGVSIGGMHCLRDLGLILTNVIIGTPETRPLTIEVPGRDGVLDCTEGMYGRMIYGNRTITFQMQTTKWLSKEKRDALISKMINVWHGKKKQIILDRDPEYYFYGRINVGTFTFDKIWTVEITCDCEPYKYLVSDPTQKTL